MRLSEEAEAATVSLNAWMSTQSGEAATGMAAASPVAPLPSIMEFSTSKQGLI
jgi:hypothetical protein